MKTVNGILAIALVGCGVEFTPAPTLAEERPDAAAEAAVEDDAATDTAEASIEADVCTPIVQERLSLSPPCTNATYRPWNFGQALGSASQNCATLNTPKECQCEETFHCTCLLQFGHACINSRAVACRETDGGIPTIECE